MFRGLFHSLILSKRSYYILNEDTLLPGDIFLSTERAKISFLIRLFTRSAFSHAALYLGNGLYVEAIGLGVRVRSIRTILKEKIKVIRLREIEGENSQSISQLAAENAHKYFYSQYWLKGAMRSVFKNTNIEERNRLFCSHLVAKAYKDTDKMMFNDLNPAKITPALLLTNPNFVDVSKETTIKTTFIPKHLIDSDFETASDKETIVIQSIYTDLEPWFNNHKLPIPNDWFNILCFLADDKNKERQKELDLEVLEVMYKNGYFGLNKYVMNNIILPMEEYLNNLPEKYLSENEINFEFYLLGEELNALKTQNERHLDNSKFYRDEYKKNSLKTFELLAENEEVSHKQSLMVLDMTIAIMHALRTKSETLVH